MSLSPVLLWHFCRENTKKISWPCHPCLHHYFYYKYKMKRKFVQLIFSSTLCQQITSKFGTQHMKVVNKILWSLGQHKQNSSPGFVAAGGSAICSSRHLHTQSVSQQPHTLSGEAAASWDVNTKQVQTVELQLSHLITLIQANQSVLRETSDIRYQMPQCIVSFFLFCLFCFELLTTH